jgi:hypothetical protein
LTKPTPQEVTDYALSVGFKLDGEAFCDFYAAKGWVIGKSPMKDWQAAVRTWKRRETTKPQAARQVNTKCCTRCGGNIGEDGRVRIAMLWKENLPWCTLTCYNKWVREGGKPNGL